MPTNGLLPLWLSTQTSPWKDEGTIKVLPQAGSLQIGELDTVNTVIKNKLKQSYTQSELLPIRYT